MSESQMWEYLKTRLEADIGMERLTDRLAEGVPDVIYTFPDKLTGFAELKEVPRHNMLIPWKSPAQPLWLSRWVRRGGIAGVVVRVTEDGSWYYRGGGAGRYWVQSAQTETVETFCTEHTPSFDKARILNWLRWYVPRIQF